MNNGTTTTRAQVSAVLDLASQRLAEVERDLKYKTELKTQLSEFLRLGDVLLDGEALVRTCEPIPLAPVPQTARQQAEDILRTAGHPMRIEEIYEQIAARGTLKGKQPKEALQTAIRHHKRVFRRVERGVYGLVAWAENAVAVGE
jgi:HB1, ASXL, restriction endonuclease HTH domain